jgi:hypothetical protein
MRLDRGLTADSRASGYGYGYGLLAYRLAGPMWSTGALVLSGALPLLSAVAWPRHAAWVRRCHPQDLAYCLDYVAEIEAARQHAAGHPLPPLENLRDFLHLSVIQAWQALADGRPTPDHDPAALEQTTYEAFVTSDGRHPVNQLCEHWLDLARQCGIAVHDQDGDPRTRNITRWCNVAYIAAKLTSLGAGRGRM